MIPQGFLKTIATEHSVSITELETLSIALEGVSTSQIAEKLGIEPAAVRKRLSEVYRRFNILGKGPGKLAKLQQILVSQYQEHQAKEGFSSSSALVENEEATTSKPRQEAIKKKVFILCSGEDGERAAECLKDTIFNRPPLETMVMNVDSASDGCGFSVIERVLEDADFGFGCITHTSFKNSWINFATGFVSGRLRNFKLIKFYKEILSGPLANLPSVDCTDKERLAKLLNEMIDITDATDWINYQFSRPKWKQVLKEEYDKLAQDEWVETDSFVEMGMRPLKGNDRVRQTKCFQHLIRYSLAEVGSQIQKVGSSGDVYSLALELYPRYLTSLQRDIDPYVKAVAIVNGVEIFWPNNEGDEIRKTANKKSERLFVFSSKTDFKNSYGFLLKHASQYNVFVTTAESYFSYVEKFSIRNDETINHSMEDYSLPTKEYAVIELNDNDCLLAWCDEDNVKEPRNKRLVHFLASKEKASLYKRALTIFLEEDQERYRVCQLRFEETSYEKVTEELEQIQKFIFGAPQPNNLVNYKQPVDLNEAEGSALGEDLCSSKYKASQNHTYH